LEDLLLKVVLFAPILLFSIIAHEIAHGYAALRQGDTTAYALGRLSWNPIKHIDPFMSILLPLFLLWASQGRMALAGAKPVPVNPRNYRNYKRGDIIVSLAGVATNFVIAIGCTILIALFGLLGRAIPALNDSFAILQVEMIIGVFLNMGLIAFNLLPIPPLDGSHVMKYLLPPAWSLRYQQLGFFGFVLLIVLMQTPFLSWWLRPASIVASALLGVVESLIIPSHLLQLIG
jgi:Zn-dependent protease